MWLKCCLFHIQYCKAFKNEEKKYLDAQAGQCRRELGDATFAMQTVKTCQRAQCIAAFKKSVNGQNTKNIF